MQREWQKIKRKVQDFVDQGDLEQALSLLEENLPSSLEEKEFLGLFVRPLLQMGREKEAKLFLNLLEQPTSSRYYQLGRHYLMQGRLDLALSVLRKTWEKGERREEVARDFAFCLAFFGYHREALQVLEGVEVLSFWGEYEKGWNGLFVGDLKLVEEVVEKCAKNALVREERKFQYAWQRLLDMKERYSLERPEKGDWQGWHFVQYGSLLLESQGLMVQEDVTFSPIGSLGSVLLRCAEWVRTFSKVRAIRWGGDDNSKILAHLLGELLDLPVCPLEGLDERSHTLLVFSRPEEVPRRCLDLQEGEVLFVPYLQLGQPAVVCPDLVGFLVSFPFVYPWNAHAIGTRAFWEKIQSRSLEIRRLFSPKEKKEAKQWVKKVKKWQSLWMAGNVERYPLGRYSFSSELPFPLGR